MIFWALQTIAAEIFVFIWEGREKPFGIGWPPLAPFAPSPPFSLFSNKYHHFSAPSPPRYLADVINTTKVKILKNCLITNMKQAGAELNSIVYPCVFWVWPVYPIYQYLYRIYHMAHTVIIYSTNIVKLLSCPEHCLVSGTHWVLM